MMSILYLWEKNQFQGRFCGKFNEIFGNNFMDNLAGSYQAVTKNLYLSSLAQTF